MAPGNYGFNVQARNIAIALAVDNNRDGQITLDSSDMTTPAQPYRFWVNDSKEKGDDESSGGADDQIPGQSYFNANYSLTHVNGSSDLVNFFPVALCLSNLLQWLPPTNGWEYHLTQNDAGLPAGMGNGAVKFVYTSLSPTNAFDYLTNTAGFGCGTNADEWATNADTIQVLNTPGTVLDTNWLAMVQNNGGLWRDSGGRLRGDHAAIDAGNLAQRSKNGRRAAVFEHQQRGANVPASELLLCERDGGSSRPV